MTRTELIAEVKKFIAKDKLTLADTVERSTTYSERKRQNARFNAGRNYLLDKSGDADLAPHVKITRRYWSIAVKRDQEIADMRKWSGDRVRPVINQRFTELAILMDRLTELDVKFTLQVMNSAKVMGGLQRGGKKSRPKVFLAFKLTIYCEE